MIPWSQYFHFVTTGPLTITGVLYPRVRDFSMVRSNEQELFMQGMRRAWAKLYKLSLEQRSSSYIKSSVVVVVAT